MLRMKMRRRMVIEIHSNDDSKKSGDDWHERMLPNALLSASPLSAVRAGLTSHLRNSSSARAAPSKLSLSQSLIASRRVTRPVVTAPFLSSPSVKAAELARLWASSEYHQDEAIKAGERLAEAERGYWRSTARLVRNASQQDAACVRGHEVARSRGLEVMHRETSQLRNLATAGSTECRLPTASDPDSGREWAGRGGGRRLTARFPERWSSSRRGWLPPGSTPSS